MLMLRERIDEKKLCETSFYFFVKKAWKFVDPTQLIDGWYIKAICDHLQALSEGVFTKLLINIPPRFGKSLIGSVLYPVWRWINDPGLRIFTGSHSDDNRTRDALKSRILLNSDWFKSHWGNKIQFRRDQNQKTKYNNTALGERLTFTTNGGITGSGGDEIGLDDPLDFKYRYNTRFKKDLNEWIDQGLSTRLNDKLNGKFYIIMQRLATDDPTGYLLSKKHENFVHLCLQNEYDSEKKCVTPIFSDPRTINGQLLRQQMSNEELSSIKTKLGSDGYATQYQQNPRAQGGNIIKREYLRVCSSLPNFDYTFFSIDGAWEIGQENDYSVCAHFGVSGNNGYLIECWRKKLQYHDFKRMVIDKYNEKHPRVLVIENKQSGKGLIHELKNDGTASIEPVEPIGSKILRTNLSTPFIEAGRFFLYDNMSNLSDVIDELITFPNADHDDIVDAITQGIFYIQGNNGEIRARAI